MISLEFTLALFAGFYLRSNSKINITKTRFARTLRGEYMKSIFKRHLMLSLSKFSSGTDSIFTIYSLFDRIMKIVHIKVAIAVRVHDLTALFRVA